METLANITARLAKCEAQIANLQQYAKVIAVDAENNLVDVEVRGVELKGIPIQTQRAGTDGKTFWMPEVDEVGLLLSPGGDVGNAVFFPAINYDDNPAPRDNANIMLRQFDGEAWEEYNRDDDTHLLRISGDTEIKTERTPGKIEAKTSNTKLTLLQSNEATLQLSPTTKAKITPTSIVIELSPTVKIEMTPTSIRLTHGINFVNVTNALVNVNGATFTRLGVTNMFSSVVTAPGFIVFPPAV